MNIGRIVRLFISAIAIVGIASACHTSRRTVAPQNGGEPAAIADAEASTPSRTYTLIQFNAQADGIGVSGQMRVAEDSAIWVSVSKFLEVGRALATTDSVYVHAPLLGVEQATDYATLSRRMGRPISYAYLQQIALSPDAEQQITQLVAEWGHTASVSILRRSEVATLSFPFPKSAKP